MTNLILIHFIFDEIKPEKISILFQIWKMQLETVSNNSFVAQYNFRDRNDFIEFHRYGATFIILTQSKIYRENIYDAFDIQRCRILSFSYIYIL